MTRYVLHVDPIACTVEGICAELFPERIRLDDWGFPIIIPGGGQDPQGVPADQLKYARWAADNCPALTLKLQATRA